MKPQAERWIGRLLFASRWLLAPMYLGLVIALAALAGFFLVTLAHWLAEGPHVRPEVVIVRTLALIDLSLVGNLMLIVILAGYENFISRIDCASEVRRPSWMGRLDFSAMKMKLVASIAAITSVALLRAFMELSEPGAKPETARLGLLVIVYLTLTGSGVLMALMDFIVSKTRRH